MLPQPGQDNYDKLGKVRLIMNILTSNFSATYEFGRDVSINQASNDIIQRPLDAKAIYAKKPVKRGIKIWIAADASNGYVSSLDVYTGRKGDNTEKGLGASVVKSLTAALHHLYHHIFFDNFFSSVNLLLAYFDLDFMGAELWEPIGRVVPKSCKRKQRAFKTEVIISLINITASLFLCGKTTNLL